MELFDSNAPGRTLLVTFDRGDLLLEGIEEAARLAGVDCAIISGGIGSLSRCNLHVITTTSIPPVDKFISFTGPVELGSVQGTILAGEAHAHIVVSDFDTNQVYVGHLEPGSVVCYRAEIALQILDGVKVERFVDETTGLIKIRSST